MTESIFEIFATPQVRQCIHLVGAEQIRKQRRRGYSTILVMAATSILFLASVWIAVITYEIGATLRSESVTVPRLFIEAAATASVFVIGRTYAYHSQALRLDTEFLLITLPARKVALGLVLLAYSRGAALISLPVLGVALGFATGLGSVTVGVALVVAAASLLAFSVLLGLSCRVLAELLVARVRFVRRYRRVFSGIVYFLPLLIWPVAFRVASLDVVFGWLGAFPFAWFADLIFLGVPGVSSGPLSGVGVIGLLVLGIPLLTALTTRLAERLWRTEPVSMTLSQRSTRLIGTGPLERVVSGTRLSRPVVTVARKRWLQERRVPRGLLSGVGFVGLVLLVLGYEVYTTDEIPLVAASLITFACATATGLAFGLDVIGSEYPSLPMTLTTISGQQFVRGTVLAGVALGGPVTVTGIGIVGVATSLGVFEMVFVALLGVVLCVCGVVLASVIGLSVSCQNVLELPIPWLDYNVYGEVGWLSFMRFGTTVFLLGVLCLPLFVGYSSFADLLMMRLGIPTSVIRFIAVSLTTMFAAGVSVLAYHRAVRLFDQYTLA